jgi:hypothetical protein
MEDRPYPSVPAPNMVRKERANDVREERPEYLNRVGGGGVGFRGEMRVDGVVWNVRLVSEHGILRGGIV